MKDGFIQQVDALQVLYSKPCNVFVAGFLGSPQMNFIDAVLVKKDGKFMVEFGTEDTKTTRGTKYYIPLPDSKNEGGVLEEYVGKEIIMGIRPEDVHNEDRLLEEYAECKVMADVEVTELMGAETFLYLNVEGFNFTARVEPTSTARPGDTIEIALENNKIHLFDKETERTICN
jgi:multiple sugar transport system ATP-binding protein